MEKQINFKNKHIVFGALFLMFIFLFSKNAIVFFQLIKNYIVGDLVLTHDNFPDIGEWMQIVTSALFSYFLLQASKESNELNKSNLKLQKQIVNYQNEFRTNEFMITLTKLNIDTVFYRGDLKDVSSYIRLNRELDANMVKDELTKIVEVIEFYEDKLFQNLSMASKFSDYMRILNSIKAYEKDLKNYQKGKYDEDEDVKRTKEFIRGLMDSLEELHKLLYNEFKI